MIMILCIQRARLAILIHLPNGIPKARIQFNLDWMSHNGLICFCVHEQVSSHNLSDKP